jgi:hypothetical protein
MLQFETITTTYLGETIELVLTESGWRAWWMHSSMGAFGDGMDYPTCQLALKYVKELMRRSGAIDTLLTLIDDWKLADIVSEDEHSQVEADLLGFIVC